MSCGLTNLASCLPEKFLESILSVFNTAIEPLLEIVRIMLTQPVNINLFHGFWAIIVYIISLFYGLYFMFAGFNFIISGYDSAKREKAKMWMKNVVLMILFIQSSFIVYNLILEFSSILTTGMINLIDPSFFTLTADSIINFGLQLLLIVPYVSIVLLTVILLALRYLVASCGVVLLPIAIFFYFIPPLKNYGKMIINVLMIIIFVTFFDSLILFGSSLIIDVGVFSSFKIIIVTTSFLTINALMVFLIVFALLKSAFSLINSDFGRNITRAVKYLV